MTQRLDPYVQHISLEHPSAMLMFLCIACNQSVCDIVVPGTNNTEYSAQERKWIPNGYAPGRVHQLPCLFALPYL